MSHIGAFDVHFPLQPRPSVAGDFDPAYMPCMPSGADDCCSPWPWPRHAALPPIVSLRQVVARAEALHVTVYAN